MFVPVLSCSQYTCLMILLTPNVDSEVSYLPPKSRCQVLNQLLKCCDSDQDHCYTSQHTRTHTHTDTLCNQSIVGSRYLLKMSLYSLCNVPISCFNSRESTSETRKSQLNECVNYRNLVNKTCLQLISIEIPQKMLCKLKGQSI